MNQSSDLEQQGNPTEDDQSLLARCLQDHDESAFAEVDRRFRLYLEKVVEKSLPKVFRSDAEDIVQQTFHDLSLYEHEELRPGTRLRPLLCRIAERNVNDYLRAQQAQKRDHHRTLRLQATCRPSRGKTLADEQNAGFEEGSEGYADPKAAQKKAAEQAAQFLHELMPTLPPHESTALDLVWLKNHTVASAAKLMKKSESTVKWWLRSGMEHLRRLGGG
jgi:RNA polymerase sigma factor (sigma-70 family)